MQLTLLTLLLAVASLTAWAGDPKPADVIVYVSGPEAPPSAVEQGARATVSWMYNRLGVRIAWRNGECKTDAPGGATIAVQVRYGRTRGGVHALASAAPFGTGTRAIGIDYGRIRGVAGRFSREQAILAHVLAHEIGHILQRTDWHAGTGVMKANWLAADFEAMQRKPLDFTAEDVKFIRLGLAAE